MDDHHYTNVEEYYVSDFVLIVSIHYNHLSILTRDFRRRHRPQAKVTRRRLLAGSVGEDIGNDFVLPGKRMRSPCHIYGEPGRHRAAVGSALPNS